MTAVDRRRLAARLAATLRDRWPRATIVVGGSVARGAGDRWSDVDLYLTTVEPVALAARYDWLRTVADPGSAIFHDQPTRAGGSIDAVHVAATDVSVCWRLAAVVEERLRAVLAGTALAPEVELAYAHELREAVVLADPLGLAAGWRAALSVYPAGRAAALAASWPATVPPSDDAGAALALYPTAVRHLHLACAQAGRWFPGPKRLDAALAAPVIAALTSTAPLPKRVAALTAQPPEVPAALWAPSGPVPEVQLLNAGCDAVGGRMLIALARGDVLSVAHYAHRALDTAARLGVDGEALAAAVSPGYGEAARREVHRRLREVWTGVCARYPAADSGYARAALETARQGLSG